MIEKNDSNVNFSRKAFREKLGVYIISGLFKLSVIDPRNKISGGFRNLLKLCDCNSIELGGLKRYLIIIICKKNYEDIIALENENPFAKYTESSLKIFLHFQAFFLPRYI